MNPAIIAIIFAIVFGMVMGAIGLGYRMLESQRKKQVEGMLNAVSGEEVDLSQPTILMNQPEIDAVEAVLDRGLYGRALKLIQQSGLPWTVSRLVFSMLIGAVIGGFIGYAFLPLGIPLVAGLIGAVVVGMLPYLFLKLKKSQRMAELETQLPEALDFLARSMRAGHAFSISLEMLGSETPDPLGQEFRVLFNELNLGAALEPALANFGARVPLLDVQLFISSVLLQRQTGGNLSEILMRLAHIIRERFRLKGQVKAASAHGRMTAAVLTVLPLVLMVAMLFVAPGYLQGMAADPTGKWMILGAIVAQLLGFLVIRKIVNIKV
jgi:tight adherence protein B